MGKLKYSLVLASVLVVSPLAAANAADLGLPPEPMPVPAPVPAAACCGGGFYLKGFMGISNQNADDITNDFIEAGDFVIVSHEFDSSPFIGLGIGYQFDRHFRFDLTGEYRSRSTFRGLDFNQGVAPITTNQYDGTKDEWLMLTNAYWDITTFKGITPYVGAGVGLANVNLRNFKDVNINVPGGAVHWAEDGSEWNFAWALHAGLAYEVSDALTLDVGYRYVNMGDGTTGNFTSYDPTVTSPGPITVKDIDSHDVMLGLRWKWGDNACCAAAPAYVETSYPTTYK